MELKDVEILEGYLTSALNKVSTFEENRITRKIKKSLERSIFDLGEMPVTFKQMKQE
jgi:hypothetical protein